MAREFAKFYLSAWGDSDWRELSYHAQWLYQHLVCAPTCSYAGVSEWRPGRIARLAGGLTTQALDIMAAELEEQHYVLIDRETEEALVRSFIRNDRVLTQPLVAVSAMKSWQGIASEPLRGVIVHELIRLQKDQRDAKAWADKRSKPYLMDVLGRRAMTPEEAFECLPKNPVMADLGGDVEGPAKGFAKGQVKGGSEGAE